MLLLACTQILLVLQKPIHIMTIMTVKSLTSNGRSDHSLGQPLLYSQ